MSSVIRLFTMLAVAAAAVCGTSTAQAKGNWLFSRDRCSRYEVGGELIVWRPSGCNLLYAVTDSRPFSEIAALPIRLPIGDKQELQPDYHPGFRVWLGYITTAQCADIVISYTRLHTRDSRKVRPHPETGGIWPTFVFPKNIDVYFNGIGATPAGQPPALTQARARFNYDAGDLEVGTRMAHGCHFWGRGFAGLHFVNLFHEFNVIYSGTISPGTSGPPGPFAVNALTPNRRTSEIWALGPEIGLQANYNAWCGFGLGGKFVAGLAAGSRKTTRFQSDFEQNLAAPQNPPFFQIADVGSKRESALIPFLGSRLGVSYMRRCMCNLLLAAEFGYEFRTYFDAMREPLFNGDRATGHMVCENISYDGFYLSLMIEV